MNQVAHVNPHAVFMRRFMESSMMNLNETLTLKMRRNNPCKWIHPWSKNQEKWPKTNTPEKLMIEPEATSMIKVKLFNNKKTNLYSTCSTIVMKEVLECCNKVARKCLLLFISNHWPHITISRIPGGPGPYVEPLQTKGMERMNSPCVQCMRGDHKPCDAPTSCSPSLSGGDTGGGGAGVSSSPCWKHWHNMTTDPLVQRSPHTGQP